MKIIKETSAELVMRIMPSPVYIIAGIISSIFVSLPLTYLLFNTSDLIIRCDRLKSGTVDCQAQRNLLFNLVAGEVTKYKSITAIAREDIEGEDADRKKFVRSDWFFMTAYGKFPIYNFFPNAEIGHNREKMLHAVNRINFFLGSQEQSIVIRNKFVFETYHIFLFVFLIIIISFCIFVIHSAWRITILSINKHQNKISESYFSILGFWKCSFNLEEIQKVEVNICVGTSTFYASVVSLKSGKMILLGYDYYQNKAAMKVSRVRKFLDLPIERF
jgi:hypothetical protein